MSNHFHVLLEVPPMPEEGITDEELFKRLGAFYSEARVAEIAKEMAEAGTVRKRGEFEMPPGDEAGQPLSSAEEAAMAKAQAERRRDEIRGRYTRRMHEGPGNGEDVALSDSLFFRRCGDWQQGIRK